jgi:hypothetical protein
MDAKKNKTGNAVRTSFITKGFMQKTVASFATVFFIFSGIPVPTSFAAAAPITLNEAQQPVSTVTLEQANAQADVAQAPIPSGAAVQAANPLSPASGLTGDVVVPGTAYNPAVITQFMNQPMLNASNGSPRATIALTQASRKNFFFAYALPDTGDFVFAYFGNGYFDSQDQGQVWVGSTTDLSSGVIFAVNGQAGKQLKVEVLDSQGQRAIVYLDLTGTRQNYSLNLTGTGIDPAHVAQIVFTVDREHMGTSGSVAVETAGLAYTPVISGNSYDPSQVTVLPNHPIVSSGRGSSAPGYDAVNGTLQVVQSSHAQFTMNYTLADADDFVFAHVGDGYFGYPQNTWVGSTMNLGSAATFSVKGPAGKQLKVEVLDSHGQRAIVYLDLTGTRQNYSLNLTGTGIDPAHVAQIVFTADREHMGTSGSVAVETAGLAYTPVISDTTPEPVTNFGAQTPVVGEVEPLGLNTVTSLIQPSANQFTAAFNLQNGGSQRWAAARIDFQSGFLFNTQSSNIVLGVHLTGASYYKLEVEDSEGLKVTFRVNVTNGNIRVTNAMLRSAEVAGFDATQIKALVLVVDDPQATTGQMTVNTQGLVYTPVISPDPSQNPSGLPGLPSGTLGQPQIATVYPPDATMEASLQPQGMSFSFINGRSGWAGGGLTFDDFGTAEYETVDLSGTGQLMFELWGTVPNGRIKMEIVAADDSRDWVYLTAITTAQGNVWKVQTANFESVDLAHVRVIYFVAEGLGQQGELHVNYLPPASSINLPVTNNFVSASSPNPATTVSGTADGIRIDFTGGSFADSAMGGWNYDNPATAGQETVDLSQQQSLIFGLSGFVHVGSNAARNYRDNTVLFTVTDLNGQTASFYLNGVTTTERMFVVPTSSFSQLDLAHIASMKFSVDGYNVAATWLNVHTGPMLPPAVPSGWTRAKTNENFAIRISHESYDQILDVMDLRTGVSTKIIQIYAGPSTGHPLKEPIDVDPSGKYVIYTTDTWSVGGTDFYVSSIQNPDDTFNFYIGKFQPLSIQYQENKILINTKADPYRPAGVYEVDLVTSAVVFSPDVPEGWTPVSSNAAVAYRISFHNTNPNELNYHLLEAMDLNTGKIIEVRKAYSAPGGEAFKGFVDVSSDGKYIVYEVVYTRGSFPQTVEVLNLNDGTVFKVFTGHATLERVDYFENHIDLHTGAVEQENVVSGTYIVQLSDGTFRFVPDVPEGWTRAASNANYAFTVGPVVVNGFHYNQGIQVMDLRTGQIQVVGQRLDARAGFYPTPYMLDMSPDGKKVVSQVEEPYEGHRWIEIFDLSSQTDSLKVGIERATVDSMVFEGEEVRVHTVPSSVDTKPRGTYIVNMTDGSYQFVQDVPEGWTRAASNANFAFHVKEEVVGGKTIKTLQLLDLMTGQVQEVVKTQPPAITTFSRYDVSADGNAVIYEMNSYMHVQSISDPATLWAGGGIPTSVSTSGHLVNFVYEDGTNIWIDTQTFQWVPMALPSGWTRAVSNPNYAIQVQTVGVKQILVVKDLMTGKDIRVAVAKAPSKIVKKYDVAPDGKTVVYSISGLSGKAGTTVVQGLADGSKRATLSGVPTSIRFVSGKWVLVINGRTLKVDPVTGKIVYKT